MPHYSARSHTRKLTNVDIEKGVNKMALEIIICAPGNIPLATIPQSRTTKEGSDKSESSYAGKKRLEHIR